MGGATGLIGDPSGRTKERNVISQEKLQNNVLGIAATLSRITENFKELQRGEGEARSFPAMTLVHLFIVLMPHLLNCLQDS